MLPLSMLALLQKAIGGPPNPEQLARVNAFYSGKVQTHGTTGKGVSWESDETQDARIDELLKVIDHSSPFSLNDLGCGYGRIYQRLASKTATPFRYTGVDLSATMVETAKRVCGEGENRKFLIGGIEALPAADYTVASGVFNVKMGYPRLYWQWYILNSLKRLNRVSSRGFAINLMTLHKDDRPSRRRAVNHSDYYADPAFFIRFCRRFSSQVTVSEGYAPRDFTLFIKK